MIRFFSFCALLIVLASCNFSSKPIAPSGLEIGNKAPEMTYQNPNGELVALSSLQGKLVLIDFWASWCPPCRKENPGIVAAYHKYKNQRFINGNGFSIYSISCDNKKEDWINAIAKDKLEWDYHVSDLKGWEAEATFTYKISVIPSNFLLDGDGIIIAKDIHGEKLHHTLDSLLK